MTIEKKIYQIPEIQDLGTIYDLTLWWFGWSR